MRRCKDGIFLSDEEVPVWRRREERGRQRWLRRWRRGVQHLHLLVLRLLRLFWCVARMRLLAGGLEYRWQTVEERLHRIPRERGVVNWVVHLLLKGTGAVCGAAAPSPPPTRLALGIFERRREGKVEYRPSVCPSVRASRGSLGHYSRHGATGAHFGSAFVHSHTLDSGRTNEQWPLYTEPKNLFSLCRRFRMWLHRMRDQTTLFEGTEPRRGGAPVRVAYQIISLLRYPSGTKIWTKSFMFV